MLTSSTTGERPCSARSSGALPTLALALADAYTYCTCLHETNESYLWTGAISRDVFDEACRFTDPTLSFVGLQTFEKNMEGLTPWVERLVRRDTRECALLSAKLDEDTRTVTVRWRMVGDFVWGARLDLEGTTVFSFREQERGGRIFSYDEVWHTPPARALLQLVTPYRRPG